MTERVKFFLNYYSYDRSIENWSLSANKILIRYGDDSHVRYPAIVAVDDIPRFTSGAFSCYAGVVQSRSGLFIFHLPESKDIYSKLTEGIGGDPIGGVYGGIPYNAPREFKDQLEDTPLQLLEPNDPAGGFNILIQGYDIFYSSGLYIPGQNVYDF